MNKLVFMCILTAMAFINFGCDNPYWPQTLEPDYYQEGAREVKEDIDDVSGARTL